ncbi:unnamed protein product [Penicillium egyptiacum]|uniref:non-specific serine/threonine protein kinase n=1 Tax=Penicillium egyptiacum TaxID=1303716 RepID=A0A9W4KBE7_9EURO|nr:unnamed protein product [Penicillium egyptiacum]
MAGYRSEEDHTLYRPGGFHPVHLGDVFNYHYEVLRKLGYGRYSTVWLVKDQRQDDFVTVLLMGRSLIVSFRTGCYGALKVLSAECYDGSQDISELEVLTRLRDSDPKHDGHRHIPMLVDSFKHLGPNGHHLCLVLEPMGENLRTFGTLFAKDQVPSSIMRRFGQQLLLASDYAHRSGVIHTDIQPRNIMIQIPDLSIIDDYLKNTTPDPMAYDPSSDPLAIVSHPLKDFYIRGSTDLMTLDVALCDWGSASWINHHPTELIQPVLLRAPEVIIGASWGPSVDIWNLGAVLLEVLDAVRMFDGRTMQTGGVFQTKHHLEEIVALFGPFPPHLLALGDPKIVAEYFDDQGNIRNPTPRPKAFLENWIESITGNDKEEFVMLLRSMMKIDPDDRPTAKESLSEAWFQRTTSNPDS